MTRARAALASLFIALAACDSGGEERLSPVDLGTPRETPRETTREPTPERTEEARDPEPGEPTEPPAPLVTRSQAIMGTVFQISVAGMDEAQAGPVIERALTEIARLEAVLSEWQDDSEISAINASAGRGAVPVGRDTMAVVQGGLAMARRSDGAFDLSWAALRGLYRFQPDDHHVPALAEVRARLPLVDWRAIEVDEAASTVRLARPGMVIGTGGIAKGYALDRAGAILQEGGAESYMMFGGGQVQVHGMRGGRPWRVGIQHPRDPSSYIGFLQATEGSISTSGDYEHAFLDETGQHWHHIIDLATGLPARRTMQVTLLAATGIEADALSTAVFVMGPERALAMLAEMEGHPEAVIIDPELRMHMTPGTRERVIMRVPLTDGRLPGDPRFRGWRQ